MEADLSVERQQRRSKRLIPDTEKDETYWEKRKRNNLAAKKSRENKRKYESLVRNRVHALEEENCLLKKELEVIKERFNIPKDLCMLSPSERDECLEACWKEQNGHCPSPTVHDTGSNVTDFSLLKYKYENTPNEISDESLEDSHTSISHYVWAATPAHSRSLQRYAESSRIYRNEISCDQANIYSGPSTANKRKRDLYLNDNMTPADLSTKINPVISVGNSERPFWCSSSDTERTHEEENDRMQINFTENVKGTHSMINTQDQVNSGGRYSNEPLGQNGDAEEDMTSSDIKSKLQLLSDQVERMQKLVCKTPS